MNRDKEFKTGDLFISAFFLTFGISPKLELQGQKVMFCFSPSDKLFELLVDYQAGATVNAIEYASSCKLLRGQMLSMKNADQFTGGVIR